MLVISSSYRNQMRGGHLERTGKVLSDRALSFREWPSTRSPPGI